MIKQMDKLSLMQQLRETTHDEHKKTEDNKLMMDLLSDNFSLNSYHLLLSSFLSFYHPIELAIKKLINQHDIDYAYQSKCPLIEHDLIHINGTISPSIDNLKQVSVSFLKDKASFLGTLYVIEGSTLGGAVIRKSIAKHINVDLMATFFYPYGALTREQWQQTSEFIEGYATQEQLDTELICSAAIDTFRSIQKVMS